MIQSRCTAVVLSGSHTLGQKPTQTSDRYLLQTPIHTHSNVIDTFVNIRGWARSALMAGMLLLPKL